MPPGLLLPAARRAAAELDIVLRGIEAQPAPQVAAGQQTVQHKECGDHEDDKFQQADLRLGQCDGRQYTAQQRPNYSFEQAQIGFHVDGYGKFDGLDDSQFGFFSPTLWSHKTAPGICRGALQPVLEIKPKICLSRFAELGCWTAGLVLSGAFLGHSVLGEVHRSQGINQAQLAWQEADVTVALTPESSAAGGNATAATTEVMAGADLLAVSASMPDQRLWSPTRIAAWQASAPQPVLAVLEMPAVDLEVPVFQGDMERGPAWIAGTARPGQAGNSGISGHRDGYFRALKDAELGDALTLRTAGGRQRYVVDDIRIVDPLDVEVLDPTDRQTVTLVTCYPFYFVGSAPQRYIVRARLDESTLTAASGEHQKGALK